MHIPLIRKWDTLHLYEFLHLGELLRWVFLKILIDNVEFFGLIYILLRIIEFGELRYAVWLFLLSIEYLLSA